MLLLLASFFLGGEIEEWFRMVMMMREMIVVGWI